MRIFEIDAASADVSVNGTPTFPPVSSGSDARIVASSNTRPATSRWLAPARADHTARLTPAFGLRRTKSDTELLPLVPPGRANTTGRGQKFPESGAPVSSRAGPSML